MYNAGLPCFKINKLILQDDLDNETTQQTNENKL